MTLENLDALPAFLPVEQLNGHVIGGGENEGLGRVNGDGSDVVGVGLEGGDLLGGVIVVDTELEVVGAADDPVLSGNEAAGSDRDIGQLEGFDDLLSLVAPDVDMACWGGGGGASCQPWQVPSLLSCSLVLL